MEVSALIQQHFKSWKEGVQKWLKLQPKTSYSLQSGKLWAIQLIYLKALSVAQITHLYLNP
jgi:hypothetical protein